MPIFRSDQDLARFMSGGPRNPSSCVKHRLPCGGKRGCPECMREAREKSKLDAAASEIMNGGGRND